MSKAADPTVADLLALVGTELGLDVRDRLAYMHITGAFPTHSRTHTTSRLRAASNYCRAASADREMSWRMVIDPRIVAAYDLDRHPMVCAVNKLLAAGWSIRRASHPTARRPFGEVLFEREGPAGRERLTVKSNGSVKAGWPR